MSFKRLILKKSFNACSKANKFLLPVMTQKLLININTVFDIEALILHDCTKYVQSPVHMSLHEM